MRRDAGELIEHLIVQWRGLPDVAQQWGRGPEDRRLGFVLNLPIRTVFLDNCATTLRPVRSPISSASAGKRSRNWCHNGSRYLIDCWQTSSRA